MAKKKDKPIIEYVLRIGYNPDDEEVEYIGTFKTMEELFEAQTKRFIHSEPILGEVLILTHTQWLDNTFPRWKKIKAYQHW